MHYFHALLNLEKVDAYCLFATSISPGLEHRAFLIWTQFLNKIATLFHYKFAISTVYLFADIDIA